jgi:hypothetical protein
VRRAAAVACIAVAVTAAVAWALHTDHPTVVGSNSIRPVAFTGTIPPGAQVCEAVGSSTLPVDGLRVTVGTEGRGPQPLRAQLQGSPPGPALRGYSDGVVTLRLSDQQRLRGERSCISNLGTRLVRIAGEQAPPGQGALVDRRAADFHVSVILVDTHPPTWWSQTAAMLGRVGLGHAWAGGGRTAGALVVLLLVACLVGAGAVVWRWIV